MKPRSQSWDPRGERGLCCNCGGPHNANYRGCQKYLAEKKGPVSGIAAGRQPVKGQPLSQAARGALPLAGRAAQSQRTARPAATRPAATSSAATSKKESKTILLLDVDSKTSKNRPLRNSMDYIEGSALAPPDGETSLSGPLAALLDACAASKDSFSFGAPKGLSKGHFELGVILKPGLRFLLPQRPPTACWRPGAPCQRPLPSLRRGHISRSAETGSVTRPTVPAASGSFPGHQEAAQTPLESTTQPAVMFSDIAKKALLNATSDLRRIPAPRPA
ncbi:hypothetical protein J6590_095652 [Homalodisca vitripennis]|nr:hypothetical protein J6590_095652 [Homalodisca vitripennis]